MKQNNYAVTVSGEKVSRQALLGAIVYLSASLTKSFMSNEDGTHFFFRYKSDARLVLKRVAKSLHGNLFQADTLEYEGARASVRRC